MGSSVMAFILRVGIFERLIMSKCRSRKSSHSLRGGGAVVKQMERVIVLVFRVDPVGREPAAQPVGAVVHDGDGLDDGLPVHARARLIEYPRDGAPGRDAHLPFLPHMADRPFGGAAACRPRATSFSIRRSKIAVKMFLKIFYL